jgi:hypothetical protein
MAEQPNEPVMTMQANFYFPAGTTYEQATEQVNARLEGLDYTSVMQEIPESERPKWMADA